MAKTLCEWSKKDIVLRTDQLARLIREPRFYCGRCARAASTSSVLCKPRRLDKISLAPEENGAEEIFSGKSPESES